MSSEHVIIPTLESTSSISNQDKTTATFNTTDLAQLSVTANDYPVEQADWIDVNEKLRENGYDPITLLHPEKCQQHKGHIVLNETSSTSLRKTLLNILDGQEKIKSEKFTSTKLAERKHNNVINKTTLDEKHRSTA